MADPSGSKDKYMQALDLVMSVLQDHEKNLDRAINQLATVVDQLGDPEELNGQLDSVNQNIERLEKDVKKLAGLLQKQ